MASQESIGYVIMDREVISGLQNYRTKGSWMRLRRGASTCTGFYGGSRRQEGAGGTGCFYSMHRVYAPA